MDKAVQERMERRAKEKSAKKEEAKRRNRLLLFGVVTTLCLCALLVRIFYYKSVYGDEYERLAIENVLSNSERTIAPVRGAILDRNKQPLVVSHTVDNIFIDVRRLVKEKPEDQAKTLQNINKYLGIPMSTLEGYLAKDGEDKLVNDTEHLVIARGVSKKVSRELFESEVKCVHADENSDRTYVHNTLASQVIGFIRGDGSWGLENQYENELSGTPGRMFDTFENTNSKSNSIPAQDGYTLVTTNDLNIQQICERAAIKAANEFESQNAMVIVMNPKTGEIYAMADNRGFDPNQPSNTEFFTDPRMRDAAAELSGEELINTLYKAWGNSNISMSMEPGSIFKPIIVAAALEEKLVSDASTYTCGGGKHVMDQYIQCWIAQYPARAHGKLNLVQGLAQSCNVMLMDIGELLGRELFYKYQHDFGFGEKTGIDLPGEMDTSSLLHALSGMDASDVAAGSIGQGFNVTPIQAITAFSALINGGNLMTPYIVSHVFDSGGNLIKETVPIIQRRVISQETSNYMRIALKSVVTPEGTGKRAVIEGYSIGGKTGTAEQGRTEPREYALSFMAYLPAENPEIIALAIINRPKEYAEGSTSTAPMLREILVDIIKYKGMQPTAAESAETTTILEGNEIALADYSGLSTAEATKSLNKTGLRYEIIGSGDVVEDQMPVAGSRVSAEGMVYLYVASGGQELIILPDVRGLAPDKATELLTSAGFSYYLEDDKTYTPEAGTEAGGEDTRRVKLMYPSPGIKMAPGTEIKLIIGQN